MREKLGRVHEEFERRFGGEANLYFSPSRINIIGEHIDYNGGKVLPCAIEIGTYALVRKRDDGIIRLHSLNIDGSNDIHVDNLFFNADNSWLNYVTGMMKFIRDAGYKIGGYEGIIFGDIPNGAGLSSSASLEMLIGKIINDMYNENFIDKIELVKFGKLTENEFIGVRTGIMDQFAIGMGKKDNAILIDTDTLEYEYIPLELGDYNIIIMNTNKRRELSGSMYNVRRSECEIGLRILKKHYDIGTLCELRTAYLPDLENYIDDADIRKRVVHVVTENDRVNKSVEAMRSNDLIRLGVLLNDSHKSLKDFYEVTGDELDIIVEAANSHDSCIGSRMTGAGFGGCAIALVKSDSCDDFISYVKSVYDMRTGLESEFFISKSSGGPVRLEV